MVSPWLFYPLPQKYYVPEKDYSYSLDPRKKKTRGINLQVNLANI